MAARALRQRNPRAPLGRRACRPDRRASTSSSTATARADELPRRISASTPFARRGSASSRGLQARGRREIGIRSRADPPPASRGTPRQPASPASTHGEGAAVEPARSANNPNATGATHSAPSAAVRDSASDSAPSGRRRDVVRQRREGRTGHGHAKAPREAAAVKGAASAMAKRAST